MITKSFTGQGRTMGMRMGCLDRPGSPIKKKQRIRTSCWERREECWGSSNLEELQQANRTITKTHKTI